MFPLQVKRKHYENSKVGSIGSKHCRKSGENTSINPAVVLPTNCTKQPQNTIALCILAAKWPTKTLLNFDKYFSNFGKMYFTINRQLFSPPKSPKAPMHPASPTNPRSKMAETNTFLSLDNYFSKFGQIHFTINTAVVPPTQEPQSTATHCMPYSFHFQQQNCQNKCFLFQAS